MSQDLGPQPVPAWPAQQNWPPQPGPWPAQPAPTYIPAYPAGPPTPKGKRFRTGIIVGIVAGIGVAILGLVIGAVLVFNANAPGSLGDDPRMDRLYAECSDGEMASCDTLFNDSAIGSDLEEFGATCGGRVGDWSFDSCTTLDL